MSNWTHINCSVRGEFTEEKLEELFGKPAIPIYANETLKYGSRKWKKINKKIYESYDQSKLPSGEHPLYYELKKGCGNYCDSDVLIIWGDLRWFEMSNEEQYKEIEDIVYKILNAFPYCVRQLTMQAYEEYSGKTYIWSSVFNSKPTLNVFRELEQTIPEKVDDE